MKTKFIEKFIEREPKVPYFLAADLGVPNINNTRKILDPYSFENSTATIDASNTYTLPRW